MDCNIDQKKYRYEKINTRPDSPFVFTHGQRTETRQYCNNSPQTILGE